MVRDCGWGLGCEPLVKIVENYLGSWLGFGLCTVCEIRENWEKFCGLVTALWDVYPE